MAFAIDRRKSMTDLNANTVTPVARRLARAATIALVGSATLVLALVVGLALYGATHAGRIYNGVSVAGVDVSGMSRSEATAELEAAFGAYLNTPIELTHEGKRFTATPTQFGIGFDPAASVDRAYRFGREESLWTRSQEWTSGIFGDVNFAGVTTIDSEQAGEALAPFTAEVAKPPQNAFVDLSTSAPTLVNEQEGVALDVGLLKLLLLESAATRSSAAIAIPTVRIAPEVTTTHLQQTLNQTSSIVAEPHLITGADGLAWTLSPDQVRAVLRISPDGEVAVDSEAIERLVNELAAVSNRGAGDARLYIDGEGAFVVAPSQQSVEVDVDASVDAVTRSLLEEGTSSVALVINREDPAIGDDEARSAAAAADAMVADGLELTWRDNTYRLSREDLVSTVTIEHRPGDERQIVVGFSTRVLESLLTPLAEKIDKPWNEPVFRLVDGEVKVSEKGRAGRTLELDASAERVIEAVTGGEPSAELKVVTRNPSYETKDRTAIELPDVLGESYTYYGNSSDARRQNVERAVALQNGWLIAPGETFSYAEFIGAVTEKNGFTTGLGIQATAGGGVMTLPVVGGGICQVSTTIFQAAFWAGLEMVERYPHSYWIQSYGDQPTGMKGLDAMVNIEEEDSVTGITLDLAFRNTTGNWMAVVAVADGEYVTTQIVGTRTGWTIEVDGPEITNVKEPSAEPVYQDSPEVPAGEVRQVETSQQGFDATIKRTVKSKGGKVLDTYSVVSTYQPASNRFLRGTGGA